jgi:hypothetical protein
MSYHEDDELNRLHEFMREEAQPVTGASLLDWLESHLAESERLYEQFKAEEEASDYDNWDATTSRLTEDGFKSALQFVIDKIQGGLE